MTLLRLGVNKTNIIYLASPHCVKSLKTLALHMGASSITPNWSVYNLGAICDQCMNMSHQYTELPTTILKNIHCLNTSLTQEALVSVVQVFATSRIDYCNSMLYGIHDYNK